MPDKHCCGTCRFGQFEWTKHKKPRPIKGIVGKCTVDIDPLINSFFAVLPVSVTSCFGFQTVRVTLTSMTTWPESGDGCPRWERRDA